MGGMRSDMGQNMRGNGHQGNGMKRRWDSNGGSSDQGQNKRPYQQSSQFGGSAAGGGYQQKPAFRSNPYDQNKPSTANVSSYQSSNYGKFASYAPMQMPPPLAAYPAAVASAVANYTFPPPSSMPPLPKN